MPVYVKNKELREELIKSFEQDELTPLALDMFQRIVNRYSLKFQYKYESDRKDCKQQAMMDLFMYWRNYDTSKYNAFAYFTQIIKNGFGKAFKQLKLDKEASHVSFHELWNL